jgi:hypothetical protein
VSRFPDAHENHIRNVYGELGVELEVLRHITDAGACLDRRLATDLDPSRIGWRRPSMSFRRVVCPAVGSHNGDELAIVDGETDVFHNGDPS